MMWKPSSGPANEYSRQLPSDVCRTKKTEEAGQTNKKRKHELGWLRQVSGLHLIIIDKHQTWFQDYENRIS